MLDYLAFIFLSSINFFWKYSNKCIYFIILESNRKRIIVTFSLYIDPFVCRPCIPYDSSFFLLGFAVRIAWVNYEFRQFPSTRPLNPRTILSILLFHALSAASVAQKTLVLMALADGTSW